MAFALGVLGLAVTASAAPLSCGATLYVSTTLHSNLNCSAYSGTSALVFGGPNLTLNLNGYSLIGSGSASNTTSGVSTAFGGDTLRNGNITSFYTSSAAYGVTGWTVTGITSSASSATLYGSSAYLDGTTGAVVANDFFTGGYYGVFSSGSSGSRVSGVTITGTTDGIVAISGAWESFVNNDVFGASYAGISTNSEKDLTVAGNTLTAGPVKAFGIGDVGAQNSSWKYNIANGFATGFEAAFGTNNQWDANVSDNDASLGVDELNDTDVNWANDAFNNAGFVGVVSNSSSSNWVNPSTNWAGNDGMDMDGFSGTITGAVSDHSSRYGINLLPSGAVTLDYNNTNRDGADGTYIYNPSGLPVTVENSTANNNAEYGFYSDYQTLGANNIAYGNGTAGCIDVTCTS